MANISDWLNKIKSAIYGREVRTALYDSINAVNKETESNTESCKKLRTDLTIIRTQKQRAVFQVM